MLPLRSSTSTGSFSGTVGPASLRRRIRRRWRPIDAVGVALLAVVAICALVALWTRSNMSAAGLRTGDGGGLRGKGRMQLRRNARLDLRTLVIYVYSGSDPEYESNLMYFLREGVKENDGVTYIIALQHGSGLSELAREPRLPPNARIVHHPNHCFDIGTVGWVLENHVPDVRAFEYFLLINSSVRGPFVPTYLPSDVHWTTIFTSKLTADTKLVGSTINCGGAYTISQMQPHVQSYAVALDQAGLAVIKRKGTVLKCHADMSEMVTLSEIGMSTAILEAGFNLDCLQIRYQGIDWRDRRAMGCNAGRNPIQEAFYDGVNVDPLEVLFVKVKASMRDARWPHVLQAKKYDEWSEAARLGAPDRFAGLALNGWTELVAGRLEEARRRGQACFDRSFYTSANQFDLGFIDSQPDPQAAAWQHFINSGMSEGRPHRFTC